MTAPAIHRTDLLPTAMNAGKEAAVRDLLRVWRRAAEAVAADQWTRFFRDGALRVGVVTDVTEAFAHERAVYTPLRDTLSIDFGLSTLMATDAGDLMGRDALRQLEKLDRRISTIARHRQKAGLRVRSPRYDRAVRQLRGWLKTEINRILNRIVLLRKPAHLTVERLDFRHPGLSKRMNRILTNCGRAAFRAKLQDLEERYGVTHTEVHAAYSSQTCSHCGWVEKNNRRSQSEFRCRCCGTGMHADVNAARNRGHDVRVP